MNSPYKITSSSSSSSSSCGSPWAKCLLILLNVVFMVAGVALALVCVYLLFVDTVVNAVYIDKYLNSDEYLIKNICSACIAIGSCIFVLSIIGIIGAVMENRCLLGTYIFVVLILLVANIGLVYCAIRYNGKIADTFETTLEKRLTSNNYTGPLAETMDIIQVELKCCGVNSPTNYEHSKFHGNHPGQNVPLSCCRLVNNKEHDDFNITTSDVISANGCQNEYSQLKNSKHTFKYLNNQGCFLKVEKFVNSKAFILGGIGVGIIAIEIIAIIFAICLCNNKRNSYITLE